jgi:hypothetical protein
MSLPSIETPIGTATLVGKDPDGTRILCMHTRTDIIDGKSRSSTYAKWWLWDGQKITEEYKGEPNDQES